MFIFFSIVTIGFMTSLQYKYTRKEKKDLKRIEKMLDEELEILDIELEILLLEHRKMVEGS